MTKKDKIDFIYEKLEYRVSIIDIMRYVKNKWWNMVMNMNWKVYFNKSWTNEEHGSYQEVEFDLENPNHLSLQKQEVIDFVYSICK